jgi:hypothetical protein
MAMEYTTKTHNGIEVLYDSEGRFNVTKLVKRYQPENDKVPRYLNSKKFRILFVEKVEEASSSMDSFCPSENLSYEDAKSRARPVRGGDPQYQGTYWPREYLHIVLMILDPEYRAQANQILDAVEDVQRETDEDVHLTVTSGDVKKELDIKAMQREIDELKKKNAEL